MSQNTAELLKGALSLPDEDRASFTEALLSSFDPQPGETDAVEDEQLLEELNRRAAELRTNPDAGVAWDAVKEMR